MNLLVRTAFDGLAFHGTQIQPGGVDTFQGLMEKLLSKIYDQPIRIRCSSRLDAKVSARDFCFSFVAPDTIEPERLMNYLNTQTESSVRVRKIVRVSDGFDARGTPHCKEYLYTLDLGIYNPILDSHAWPIYKPLDRDLLIEALNRFVGTHDFRSFASSDSKNPNEDFRSSIDFIKTSFSKGGKLCRILIRGWAFHRYQVRLMVGAAARIAMGKDPVEIIDRRLEDPDLDCVKVKAPPEGLLLWHTIYRGEVERC